MKLYAKTSEISNLVNGILTSQAVNVKNLKANGIETTQLRINNTFSFQGDGVKWHRIEVTDVGGYTVLMRT